LSLLDSGLGEFLQRFLRIRNFEVLNFNNPDRKDINSLINQIRKETKLELSNTAAQELYIAVKATAKIDGDIAEVGVYRGGSAKAICSAKGDRDLHLFDTFNGIPKVGSRDSIRPEPGQYFSDIGTVKEYLAGFPNVHFYEGTFPETAGPVEGKRFSFVHLDVGSYESTVDCLRFFYPRINQGGAIISHDYSFQSGTRRAIDEFFSDKPEIVLELPGYQALMIKL
jgi:O-methyltransferase